MPEIPRRLPPGPEERLSTVVSRMAGGSSAGATRWASPLRSGTYRPTDALAEPEAATDGPLLDVLLVEAYHIATLQVPVVASATYLVEHFVNVQVTSGYALKTTVTTPVGSVVSPRASMTQAPTTGDGGGAGLVRTYPVSVGGTTTVDYESFLVTAGADGLLAINYSHNDVGLTLIRRGCFLRATLIPAIA